MRPWILLGAAALGLGIAGLLAWPRSQAPVLLREAPLADNLAPSGQAASEAAPGFEPGAESPESEALVDDSELLADEFAPTPTMEEEAPPESESEAERDSEFAPLVGAGGAPSRMLVRAALADAAARQHPELDLSPADLDRGADAVLRIREAQEALAALPFTPENTPQRILLRDRLRAASEDFRKAMGLSPGEFTKGLEPSDGVDSFDPDEPIPPPSFLGDPAQGQTP